MHCKEFFLGGYFHDRLAASYDAAKGFVVAQDEVKKLVDSESQHRRQRTR